MNGELDRLIAYIRDNFPFNEEAYPELKSATEEEKKKFAVRHSALHFSKTAGKIASVSEDTDHGEEIDQEKLEENIPKALINVLRLAEIIGMTEKDIIKALEEKYKKDF